jgi:hypothetical protein
MNHYRFGAESNSMRCTGADGFGSTSGDKVHRRLKLIQRVDCPD